jgi:hypothetical protein
MFSKVVSAHQPNFMPYLGFFDKMQASHIFVIRDEVLFVKKEFHNRNRIRINSHDNINSPGSKWISVPVEDPKDYIKHAKIKRDSMQKGLLWSEQIRHDIEVNYQKAPFYKKYSQQILGLFDNSDTDLLSLNMKIIEMMRKLFNIKVEIVFASELGLKPGNYQESDASEDLANICKALGADVYLSGQGGKGYLSTKFFENIGVRIEYQNYQHPTYTQCFPGFVPYLSAVDALFCVEKMPGDEG